VYGVSKVLIGWLAGKSGRPSTDAISLELAMEVDFNFHRLATCNLMGDIRKEAESSYDGMTINERLFVAGVLDQFDAAVRLGDRDKMIELLETVRIDSAGARRTADTILAHPTRYGRIDESGGLKKHASDP
jgi:hypothetical protein